MCRAGGSTPLTRRCHDRDSRQRAFFLLTNARKWGGPFRQSVDDINHAKRERGWATPMSTFQFIIFTRLRR